jgi:hypothetical protein
MNPGKLSIFFFPNYQLLCFYYKMASEENKSLGDLVTKFDTYKDYLDSQITELDLFYLQDIHIIRKLVECGFRGTGEVLKRNEFEKHKAFLSQIKLTKKGLQNILYDHASFTHDNVLCELARRERPNREGILNTIIFIRIINQKGIEISSYIDYADRLVNEDFSEIFSGTKKVQPSVNDLSYYNWRTQKCYSNESSNYSVLTNNLNGILFKNKKTRVIINVDPFQKAHELSSRIEVDTKDYLQFIFFDHVINA